MWHFSDNRERPRNSREARTKETAGISETAEWERELESPGAIGESGDAAGIAESDGSLLVSNEERARSSEFHQML